MIERPAISLQTSLEREAWLAARFELWEASQREATPPDFRLEELALRIERGVFSPLVFESTRCFAALVPYWHCDTFLDLGCGTGAIGLLASRRQARTVVATDISPVAVANARANAHTNGVRSVRFAVGAGVDFLRRASVDIAFWNWPWLWIDPDDHRPWPAALADRGYVGIRTVLEDLPRVLRAGGVFYLGTGALDNRPLLNSLAADLGWEISSAGAAMGDAGMDYELLALHHCSGVSNGNR